MFADELPTTPHHTTPWVIFLLPVVRDTTRALEGDVDPTVGNPYVERCSAS